MASEATLIVERSESWLTMWLNDPKTKNALSNEMVSALDDTLDAVRQDRSIRGITLRGAGGVFCSGGDLRGFRQLATGEASTEQVAEFSSVAGRLFHKIHTQPQVVVVLIEGAAMAGGLGIACAADIVASTRNAVLGVTETMIGVPPAQIAPFVAGRVGAAEARRIMLTGLRFDGEEAARIGIANAVVDHPSDLDAFDQRLRKGVLRCAPGANAATKEVLLSLDGLRQDEMIAAAGAKFAECLLGPEGREGVASFLEKRKPAWNKAG